MPDATRTRQGTRAGATSASRAGAAHTPRTARASRTPRAGLARASRQGAAGKAAARNGAALGFEAKLWEAADKLRNNVDPAESKHVVLGLIFLKYISDAFAERRDWLEAATRDPASDYFCRTEAEREACLEDRDEYLGANVFWVPAEARWSALQAAAKQPDIGRRVDAAMAAIEKENPSLRGVLPKDYARPTLDQHTLGELIDLVATIGLGDAESRSKDVLGRVYEYFLGRFAGAEGKGGGEFYTPRCVVRLLVEMLEPFRGRVYDPCCGSGGMFVLANPPFNVSDWKGELLREDARWRYGVPPVGNANFAWVQHIIHHLAPNGVAGFVLANGSMSSNQSGEGEIRKNIVLADLVDCMIALPGQLFYTTPIPACLWFLARNKADPRYRDRRGETLFIDARRLGVMVDRTHRELTDEEIARIARTYHAWRGQKEAGAYEDVPGFCKSVTTREIEAHGFVLTPGRYVGAAAQEDDDEPFAEKMARLTKQLAEQFAESARLEQAIRENLRGLGYGL